ncbi:MAG: hypothetical protein ISS65_00530 [Desulfobacterales bacterium]|nr:hypothetical protein [Desulfobacterales bacterium]
MASKGLQQEFYQIGKETRFIMVTAKLIEFLNNDVPAAILLNQILYWHDRTKNSEKWFYKTYKAWEQETRIKESVARRCFNIFKSMDIVEVRKRKINGTPVLNFRVKIDLLKEKYGKFITENYPKT